MNMNCSGHAEVRDPDWYSRSSDRAKLSPNTLDTESLQNSLTSLNLDSLTMADLDHYSVRSLPVISSSASIAAAHDAPWNESPRSLRTPRTNRASSKPPAGMSALDHLQNSISSLAGSHMPPLRNIITEENGDDSDGDDNNFEGSIASLRIADLNEMDATAHAGNVTHNNQRSSAGVSSAPMYPVSPQRFSSSSQQRSSAGGYNNNSLTFSPQRRSQQFRGDSSFAGSSITSRGSMRYRYGNNNQNNANNNNSYNAMNEPSLSTLGDDDDDDDDNLEIIKLLRNQVDTLKGQLLDQQQQNQELSRKMPKLPNDSINANSSSCFGHDYSDCDSFGEEKETDVKDDASLGSLGSSKCSLNSVSKMSARKKLADAESAVFGAIAALKVSFRKQQQQKEEQPIPVMQVAQPVPVDVEDDEHLLMDELVLCELEAHVKVMQRVVTSQQQSFMAKNEQLRKQTDQQTARIADLERQLKEQP